MPHVDVIIDLTPQECEAHYAGRYERIIVSSVDGRRVMLPAERLRQVVLGDGIHGIFRLSYDDNGQFRSLRAVERWAAE